MGGCLLRFLRCFASGRISRWLTINVVGALIARRGALRRNRLVVSRGGTGIGGFAFSFSGRVVLRHSASKRERQQACCQQH